MADSQIRIGELEEVYAQSLLELADEKGELDAVAEEVDQIRTLLDDQPQLLDLLSTRTLSREERAGIIDRLFKGNVSQVTYGFLRVLNDKSRIVALPGVAVAFSRLLDQKRGLIEVDAYVAHKLDEGEASRVSQRIGEAFGKTVKLTQHTDPALIGGLKLRMGDRLVDGSVITQLKILKQKMIESGREKARTQTDQMIGD